MGRAWSSIQREKATASAVESKRNGRRPRHPVVEDVRPEAARLGRGLRAAEERDREAALGVGERHVDRVLLRPRSTSRPSGSSSSYSPSSSSTGPTTATGTTAIPVIASVALTSGVRSWSVTTPSRPSRSWRARIDSGSFLRGQRLRDEVLRTGSGRRRRRGRATSRGARRSRGPHEAAGRRCPA